MDSKEKFSLRADDYSKYRPTYPPIAVDYICSIFNISENSLVADIGSGTGIFTSMFNHRVKTIFGVEPNNEMRDKSMVYLKNQKNYQPVMGDYENTNLDDNLVDLVVSAQAFHWFDAQKAKSEFKRILKDPKQCALIWNQRDLDDPFFAKYEEILFKFCNHYGNAAHNKDFAIMLNPFFYEYDKKEFSNPLEYDYTSICGLLRSSSYTPLPTETGYEELFKEMKILFDDYSTNGKVILNYKTKLFYGTI